MNRIAQACKIVGSQAMLAHLIGVSPAAVNQWISGHRPVPVERCVAIERATHGQVTRKDLRPNDYSLIWPELADSEASVKVEEAA